jgi:uncharacterized membrane protein YhaH (DUF805 family)
LKWFKDSASLVAFATIVTTVVFLLRWANVLNWNFDLMALVLTQSNLLAELILTGLWTLLMLLIVFVFPIFLYENLGAKRPLLVVILVLLITFLSLWLPTVVFLIVLFCDVLAFSVKRAHKKGATWPKCFQQGVRWILKPYAVIPVAISIVLTSFPTGVLASGTLEIEDSKQVTGLLLPTSTDYVVVDPNLGTVRHFDRSAVILVSTSNIGRLWWMKSPQKIFADFIQQLQ